MCWVGGIGASPGHQLPLPVPMVARRLVPPGLETAGNGAIAAKPINLADYRLRRKPVLGGLVPVFRAPSAMHGPRPSRPTETSCFVLML